MKLKPLTALDQRIAVLLPKPSGKMLDQPTPEWFAAQAVSENTYHSYRSCLRDFVAWAGIDFPFPTTPRLVAQYLTDRRNRAYKTLRQYLHALSYIHRKLNYPDPTKDPFVKNVLDGLARVKAGNGESEDAAPAFTIEQFKAMIAAIDAELADAKATFNATNQRVTSGGERKEAANRAQGVCLRLLRDRAYLLVGFFGGFRQSEVNAISVDRLVKTRDGIVIPMGAVKQDPRNECKFVKAIPFGPDDLCPVRTLEHWLEHAGIEEGPVFRGFNRWGGIRKNALSHTATNSIIKHWATKAGLVKAEQYSGHSLRASFVTILRDMGVQDAQIARQTHHKNLQMMQVYDRQEDAFRGNGVSILAAVLAGDISLTTK